MPTVLFLVGETSSYGLAEFLRKAGYDCHAFGHGRDLVGVFDRAVPDVIVADWNASSKPGCNAFFELRRANPRVPLIVLAGPAEIAADATIVAGAFECLVRPVQPAELYASVQRALEVARSSNVVAELAETVIGVSHPSREMLALVRRVAPSRAIVLLQSEDGAGNEQIAQLLHSWSDRRSGPFVSINCRASAAGALESQLFGYDRGAVAGQIDARAGCFERASGGTLLLDEISEISFDLQARLLRVLEEDEVLRIGGMHPLKVDVRVLAATNRVLRDEVLAGHFREDLFSRLNVITLSLPPLRERPGDILPLAEYFLASVAGAAGREIKLSAGAREVLLRQAWPGNIRELQNVISRAVALASGDIIAAVDVDPDPGAPAPGRPVHEGSLQQSLDDAAKLRIHTALDAAGGNRSQAARALSIDRTTLYRFMRRLGVRT